MFTITSTYYNLLKMNFQWKDTLQNWVRFLDNSGEIVLVINKSTDDTLAFVKLEVDRIKVDCSTRFKIIEADIPYDDPEFDGKLKNIAYKNATENYIIALDADEAIGSWTRDYWVQAALALSQRPEDAFFIPVVDLYKDQNHYKDINFKFYLVKNKKNICRGVVNYGRKENGKIDITRSDTTEYVICDTNELIKAAYIINPALPNFMKINSLDSNCFVYHLGWIDKEYRKKINAFWNPVWTNRAGEEVTNIPLEDKDFEKISFFQHNLPHWNA